MARQRLFPPRPLDWKRDSSLELNDADLRLFDSVVKEQLEHSGTDIELYTLEISKTSRDPFYEEAEERKFNGPYKIRAYVAYPAQTPQPGKDGVVLLWDCTCWIARSALEEISAPAPNPGDVVRIWPSVFYNKDAVFDEKVPKSGFYFNVENVNPDGHLHDTSSFVGFKLTLKRRTDFTPERRVSNT